MRYIAILLISALAMAVEPGVHHQRKDATTSEGLIESICQQVYDAGSTQLAAMPDGQMPEDEPGKIRWAQRANLERALQEVAGQRKNPTKHHTSDSRIDALMNVLWALRALDGK